MVAQVAGKGDWTGCVREEVDKLLPFLHSLCEIRL